MKLPNKKYHIVLADPPWEYGDRVAHGKVGGRNWVEGAERHYSTMPVDDMAVLNIPRICEANAVLFMWATFPNLPSALALMDAWGFRYKTVGFTWIKLECDGSTFFGTGAYSKANAEVCLMGVRGRVGRLMKGKPTNPKDILRPVSNFVSSVVTSVRNNRSGRFHSVKPKEVHRRIEILFGNVSRIELFARRKMPGWDAWGDQI